MNRVIIACAATLIASSAMAQTVGRYSANPYAGGSRAYTPPSYGNQQQLYTNGGQYRGNLNTNQYDPNSVANPYGRYGSQYSQDSINNPYGAGSRYKADSPSNPYGQGLQVCGVYGCD